MSPKYAAFLKPGLYVYDPLKGANVPVIRVYTDNVPVYEWLRTRVSVPGHDAPYDNFSRPSPHVETVLYNRTKSGAWKEIGRLAPSQPERGANRV